MGGASKEIAKILNDRLSKVPGIKSYEIDRIDAIKTFDVAKPIIIGDIKITPYTNFTGRGFSAWAVSMIEMILAAWMGVTSISLPSVMRA